MGVFGAVFGCSGDAGFSGALLGVCSGVVGFNVAMVSCLVRDNVRPAALCHRESAKKFAQCAQIGPNSAFLRLLGEFFRGDVAGGAVLGELLRANWPCVGLGCDAVHFRVAAVGGFAPCEASGGVSPACRRLGWRHSPVWRRGRAVGCEPTNYARNSSVTISGFELVSFELQRFGLLLKLHAIE